MVYFTTYHCKINRNINRHIKRYRYFLNLAILYHHRSLNNKALRAP